MECLYTESVNTRLLRLLAVSLQILGSLGWAGRTAAAVAAALEAARARARVPGAPWPAGGASLAEQAAQRA